MGYLEINLPGMPDVKKVIIISDSDRHLFIKGDGGSLIIEVKKELEK